MPPRARVTHLSWAPSAMLAFTSQPEIRRRAVLRCLADQVLQQFVSTTPCVVRCTSRRESVKRPPSSGVHLPQIDAFKCPVTSSRRPGQEAARNLAARSASAASSVDATPNANRQSAARAHLLQLEVSNNSSTLSSRPRSLVATVRGRRIARLSEQGGEQGCSRLAWRVGPPTIEIGGVQMICMKSEIHFCVDVAHWPIGSATSRTTSPEPFQVSYSGMRKSVLPPAAPCSLQRLIQPATSAPLIHINMPPQSRGAALSH